MTQFISKHKNIIFGPIQMLLSAIFFSLMSYFAKLSTFEISGTEVSFFRLLLGSFVAFILIRLRNEKIISPNFKMLFVRGLCGGLSVVFYFLALEKGSISNSVVLQNSYPIFAAIIAIFVLHEKLTFKTILFLFITFLGMVLLVNPNINQIRIGDMFAIISALIAGFAITAVRQLRKNNESVWIIFFYFSFFGGIFSFLISFNSWKWPTLSSWIFVACTSIFGLLGQVMMTGAYKYCSSVLGGILSMSTSVFSFLLGVILLSEMCTKTELFGILLIIIGNVFIVANTK